MVYRDWTDGGRIYCGQCILRFVNSLVLWNVSGKRNSVRTK